ncbi:hypothetical protein BC832DRAFT_569535 [Gaertneriomyces semiglobifer]|nr:hypothetical protein BC832DRAFT_569535 [Gaertneriomyces semiglobifer]
MQSGSLCGRLIALLPLLALASASYTPHVCTFPSVSDCNTYTNPTCMTLDQLSTIRPTTCEVNDGPQLFTVEGADGTVCSVYTKCSATLATAHDGDIVTVNDQSYVVSSGTSLTPCAGPGNTCTSNLTPGVPTGKFRIGSEPGMHTLDLIDVHLTLPGIQYTVVGLDALITDDGGLTFRKSLSNPPALHGYSIITGKGAWMDSENARYTIVPIDADDLDTDSSMCTPVVRFHGGYDQPEHYLVNFKSYSGLAPGHYLVGMEPMFGAVFTSIDCDLVKVRAAYDDYRQSSYRLIMDGDTVLALYDTGELRVELENSGGYGTQASAPGCLSNGMFYLKVMGGYRVYDTPSCPFELEPVTGSPVYEFSFASTTLYASEAEIIHSICLQEGSLFYKLTPGTSGNAWSAPTVEFFSSATCTPNPTVEADTILGGVTENCASLNPGDYAVDGFGIVQVQSTSFSCSSPNFGDVGTCQDDSCLYEEGAMAGKLTCTSVGGAGMGMIYVADPPEVDDSDEDDSDSPPPPGTPSTKFGTGKLVATIVTPVVAIPAAAALVFYRKSAWAKRSVRTGKVKGANTEATKPTQETTPVSVQKTAGIADAQV